MTLDCNKPDYLSPRIQWLSHTESLPSLFSVMKTAVSVVREAQVPQVYEENSLPVLEAVLKSRQKADNSAFSS